MGYLGSHFSNGLWYQMPCGFLVGFGETRTYLRTRGYCHVSTSGSGCDNFIDIRVVGFLNSHSVFTSLVDICFISVMCILLIWNWIIFSFWKQWIYHHVEDAINLVWHLWMLPRHHTLLLCKQSPKSNLNSKFHQCHNRIFPPMILEAYQAYMNF